MMLVLKLVLTPDVTLTLNCSVDDFFFPIKGGPIRLTTSFRVAVKCNLKERYDH